MEVHGKIRKLVFIDGWCRLNGLWYMVCQELYGGKFLAEFLGHKIGLYDTLPEAQAACQQHFEQLIAGAVEPLPAESVDELCKICNLPLANHANGRHGYHQPETKG